MNRLIKPDRDYSYAKNRNLTPMQLEAVEFALSNLNSVLGLQTGMGKTFCSITVALRILEEYPDTRVVVLCPKAANKSFQRELTETFNQPYSIRTTDTEAYKRDAKFIIFNYTNLEPFLEYVNTIDNKIFLIMDEVHILQNRKSKTSEILWSVRHRFAAVLGLTATPLQNYLDKLYWILSYIRPGCLGTYAQYCTAYIIYREQKLFRGGRNITLKIPDKFKNLESLKPILDRIVIVRRLKYDIDFIYRPVELSSDEIQSYYQAADGIINDPDDVKDFSARMHDLQRVVDGILTTSPAKASSKEREAVRIIQEITARNEGVIVFTEYEDTYRRLLALITKYQSQLGINNIHLIVGAVPFKTRKEVETLLKPRDVVIITRAGSQSINLQKVNNVLFYDCPFSVGQFTQTVGRIARMDSTYDKFRVYILEAVGTIDTYRRELIERHSQTIRILFGEEGNLPDVDEIDKVSIRELKNKLLWKRTRRVKG